MPNVANFVARSASSGILLEWDAAKLPNATYRITRLLADTESPAEVLETTVRQSELTRTKNRLAFTDSRNIKRNAQYFYSVTIGTTKKNKFTLVFHQQTAPQSLVDLKIDRMSRGSISIDWRGYEEEGISRFHVYVEQQYFNNISNLQPVASLSASIRTYVHRFQRPAEQAFVAVVPESLDEKKSLTINPKIVIDPYTDVLSRSPFIAFSISPLAGDPGANIIIDLIEGELDSSYAVFIGDHQCQDRLITDGIGSGRVISLIPEGIKAGRYSVTLDNGQGSVVSTSNYFLVPVRLSPDENDFIDTEENATIIAGFNTEIIDRVRFRSVNTESDTVAFKFSPGSDLASLNLDPCACKAMLETAAFDLLSGNTDVTANIPIRVLPSFVYPPFIYNSLTGSLNLTGLVQKTLFSTVKDWAEQVNEYHVLRGGIERVITSIIEFDVPSQTFGNALIDTGSSYENDYPVAAGKSYWVEVKEPVSDYCVSADGFNEFEYSLSTQSGGAINNLILVATSPFTDAEGWADHINNQHVLGGGLSPRVVNAIVPWDSQNQLIGEGLVDTGLRYEGNFTLEEGKGYLVEVKESISAYIITGQPLTTDFC